MDDKILYAVAVAVVLVLVYNLWFRPEYLTDDEIAQSLIANAILHDPQDSTAVIRAMPLDERRRYEHLVGLPYNPNYYRDSKECMVGLPYNPNYYRDSREHMNDKFIMALNA